MTTTLILSGSALTLLAVTAAAACWFFTSTGPSPRSVGPRLRMPRRKTAGAHHARRT